MTIVDSGPKQGTTGEQFRRYMYAIAGGDRIVSGLGVTYFANRTVRLAAGSGVVDGIGFSVPSSLDFTSAVNSSSSPRVDRLVARVYRSIVPHPTLGEVISYETEIVILAGAPATVPALPALRQFHDGPWEFGLAYWVVPGNSGGNITNGKVWGHYADDGGRYTGDSTAVLATGRTALLLETEEVQYSVNQFALPGSGRVKFDVTASCLAQGVCGGSLILQMAGESTSVNWKAMAAGPFLVSASVDAPISASGGRVPALVQMAVEGALDAATPLRVGRIAAHQYEVMP